MPCSFLALLLIPRAPPPAPFRDIDCLLPSMQLRSRPPCAGPGASRCEGSFWACQGGGVRAGGSPAGGAARSALEARSSGSAARHSFAVRRSQHAPPTLPLCRTHCPRCRRCRRRAVRVAAVASVPRPTAPPPLPKLEGGLPLLGVFGRYDLLTLCECRLRSLCACLVDQQRQPLCCLCVWRRLGAGGASCLSGVQQARGAGCAPSFPLFADTAA